MIRRDSYGDRVELEGYAIIPGVLSVAEVERWRAEVDSASATMTDVDAVRDRGSLYAIRNLFDVIPALRTIATLPAVRQLVEPVLGPKALLVKGMLFDKSDGANWGVFWHQDLSVPVRIPDPKRHPDVPGFGPWTRKGGVVCVQPPVTVLERMLAVRLHLDPCTADNGPLRVLAGSHRHARLSDAATAEWTRTHQPIECLCDVGAAIVMRPLLLHSSPKCTVPARRRVLHFEFAADDLPSPLDWHERIPLGGGVAAGRNG
ncbi:MAG: phytanoyl-CoA dioxygenase family protein [Planctomycetaceae bacterium]|nr:phytanoyl-CoA dioxygenase family protein [Planctomycetaceae bacterium]